MNLLFSTIGKRGYIADYFREHLSPEDRIIGSGNNPWTPGFARCDDIALMPNITSDEYLPAVLDACKRHEIDAILSFADPDTARLSIIHEELTALGITPVLPRRVAADRCFDKCHTAQFLHEIGILHPRTAATPDEAADFTYPLYVKPRTGSGSRNNFVIQELEQLQRVLAEHDDMIIQEFVVGREVNVDVLGDLSGRIVSAACWNKQLSRAGETECAISVQDDEVLGVALKSSEALGLIGPMDIDLMRTERGVALIEFNPRFGGGYPVSHFAGADFPGKIVAMLRGEEVVPDFSFRAGIGMMKELRPIGGPVDDVPWGSPR